MTELDPLIRSIRRRVRYWRVWVVVCVIALVWTADMVGDVILVLMWTGNVGIGVWECRRSARYLNYLTAVREQWS